MGNKGYDDPKPWVVLGVDQQAWGRDGRRIPTRDEYHDYYVKEDKEPGDYDEWSAQAFVVRDRRGKDSAPPARLQAAPPVEKTAPVKADAIPPAPVAVPMLPWNWGKAAEVKERPLNVDLPVATLAALKRYAAARDLKLKVVVAGMLNAMLAMEGCPPGGE